MISSQASLKLDHTYHNTIGNSTLGKYVIIIPRFDSGMIEEWNIFVDLVQKVLVGQNITTGSPMHKCMELVLKDDSKVKFMQQA